MTNESSIPPDLYRKVHLGRKVLWAMLLGVLAGIALQLAPPALSELILPVIGLGGTLFLELLKMVVIPLVITSLFTGVAKTGPWRSLRSVLGRCLLYFAGSSLIAVLIGLIVVNIVPAPLIDSSLFDLSSDLISTTKKAVAKNPWTALFSNIVPSYPLESLESSDILGVMLFTCLFAFFTSYVSEEDGGRVTKLVQSCDRIVHKVAYAVISLDPYGVFCLITLTVAGLGWEAVKPLFGYLITVLGALALFALVALPILLWVFTKRSPITLMRQVAPALMTAFSTTSSTATLPLTIECSVHFAKLSSRVAGIVLPLGAHLNVCGRALFEGVTVVFIARSVGFELSWWNEAQVLLASLALSVGGSGLPHSGLQKLGGILLVVGLPSHLAGLIIGVDKLVAMVSSTTTVWSNVVGAAIVDHGMQRNAPKENLVEPQGA